MTHSTALVMAEHDRVSLKPSTYQAVAAAQQCGGDVHVLVAGHQAGAAAQSAARIPGVAMVLHADGEALAEQIAETFAAQVVSVAHGYTHLVFPSSSHGKNTAPRVAALLDVAQVSDVIRVVGADTFERTIYAGNAVATVQSRDAVKVMTVRSSAFDAVAASGGAAVITSVPAVSDSGLATFVSREVAKSERPELGNAQIVVSGGRALGSSEHFLGVLSPLADKLGAALGASRAAVDAGYAPNDWQVGQTGKIVAPRLYIACGISGAIQHQAGMKDSHIIVAINKDPEAPIFEIADYGLVADLFDVVPKLVAAL